MSGISTIDFANYILNNDADIILMDAINYGELLFITDLQNSSFALYILDGNLVLFESDYSEEIPQVEIYIPNSNALHNLLEFVEINQDKSTGEMLGLYINYDWEE